MIEPTPQRTLHWVSAGLALLLLGTLTTATWLMAFPIGQVHRFVDLDSYRATLDAVARGELMFDWLGYPPVSLILLSPLRGLPEIAGNELWTGGSILLVFVLAAAITKLAMAVRSGDSRTDRLGFLAGFGLAGAALMLSEPVNNHLLSGQVSLIVLTLAFVDAAGVLPRKWQGTLVGLAAAIKLTPLIFFPYYLLTRQWRQLVIATASFGVATGIGFALFPRDSLYFWTHTDSSGRLGTGRLENVSVLGTLTRWMADPNQARMVWYGLALIIGVAAFIHARRHFGRGEQVEAALVIGCASTAISPIAWPHYQVWLVLAALWLIALRTRRSRIVGVLTYLPYSLVFVVPVLDPIFSAPDDPSTLGMRILWEITVVVPVLISVLGLPRRSIPAERPAALVEDAPDPQPSPPVPVG